MQKHYVRSLFDSIAGRYDLLNHLLSGGMDFSWRRRAIEALRPVMPRRILDVATGTADVAIAALRLSPESVVGVDIAGRMLDVGRRKISRRGAGDVIELRAGEAEALDFPDNSFDAATVAFGVRNFEQLEKGLSEMARVLRPGGMIVILEFSRPRRAPLRQIYFFYFLRLLPRIGKAVSKSDTAYQYLPDTVMRFPEGEEFLRILRTNGFESVTERRLTFGIVTLYTGTKRALP